MLSRDTISQHELRTALGKDRTIRWEMSWKVTVKRNDNKIYTAAAAAAAAAIVVAVVGHVIISFKSKNRIMAKRQRAKVHLGWARRSQRCQLNVNQKWVHAEWIWMNKVTDQTDNPKQRHVEQVHRIEWVEQGRGRGKQFRRYTKIEKLKSLLCFEEKNILRIFFYWKVQSFFCNFFPSIIVPPHI